MPGEDFKQGRLARAIWANQGDEVLISVERKLDLIQGLEAGSIFFFEVLVDLSKAQPLFHGPPPDYGAVFGVWSGALPCK